MKRAVFLDRDGTINAEVNYLRNVTDLKILDGVARAIHRLNECDWLIVIVTNQSGIARGYYTHDDVDAIHSRIRLELAVEGAKIDAIYYCPHKPEDGCDCRKPAHGLYVRAAENLDIDLCESYIVGDKVSDLLPAQALGCRSILVLTGHGIDQAKLLNDLTFAPDHIAPDLVQAVAWILEQSTHYGSPSETV